jgi:hypothetical protein
MERQTQPEQVPFTDTITGWHRQKGKKSPSYEEEEEGKLKAGKPGSKTKQHTV